MTQDDYERIRFRNGLVVWGVAIVIVACPELRAAAPHWATPQWHTISNTTGHLEQLHHWVALVVVALIVAVIAYGVRIPPPRDGQRHARRSPGGRLLPRSVSEFRRGSKPSLQQGLAYLGVTVVAVAASGYLVSRSSGYASYHLDYAMYGSLALLLVIVPLVAAAVFKTEVPFTTIFATALRIERRSTVVGVLLLAAFVILILHLALYPWPNYSHLPPAVLSRV
jgi:hypothetical protein